MYIATTHELVDFAERIGGSEVLAVDTEFMREKTYFARLCLIQVATTEVAAVVDPLAIEDLSPLFGIMQDPRTTKVFHAGSQDLEILYRVMGSPVAPVFDTQVAATLTGQPSQVGYQQLVSSLLGVRLDKAHTYTDWSARPLSREQIDYAFDDVRYLPDVYHRLRDQLESEGRMGWLAEDFERMADPATYTVIPEEQYRRVKRASSLDRRSLAVLREVAAWRERTAQAKDLPRRWVLSDESLLEIARRAPTDEKSLAAIRGVTDQAARRYAVGVVAAVRRGLETPEAEWPRLPKRHRPAGDVSDVADMMSALVRVRAREHGVAASLLAPRDELERFAAGERDGSPLSSGWRRTLVGAELEALLEGQIALRVDGGHVVVEPRGSVSDVSPSITDGE
ncbi:MAG: ribonuclease D [Coriobacteriales bacterium]|nr:ribonuclease D [Actinomycetes bacterium]